MLFNVDKKRTLQFGTLASTVVRDMRANLEARWGHFCRDAATSVRPGACDAAASRRRRQEGC